MAGIASVRADEAAHALWIRLARLGFGLLFAFALVEDFRHTSQTTGNFFSFFTVQSNIFGVIILLIGASGGVGPSLRWAYVRGGAMIFLALTGLIYNVLLRGLGTETPPWINNTLHVLAPIVMVLDFLIDPVRYRLRFVTALVWTVYPLTYVAYSLLRGPLVDWYPYPFLDPNGSGGWTNVVVHVIVIAAGFVALSWVVVTSSNWRLARSTG